MLLILTLGNTFLLVDMSALPKVKNGVVNHFKNSFNDGYYRSSWKNKNKTSSKNFPSNVQKDSTYNLKHSNLSTSTPKSPTKTLNRKCFKYLGFGHIASSCPSKRNMMIKERVVMSDHSSQR